jgi:hypothetical protein
MKSEESTEYYQFLRSIERLNAAVFASSFASIRSRASDGRRSWILCEGGMRSTFALRATVDNFRLMPA